MPMARNAKVSMMVKDIEAVAEEIGLAELIEPHGRYRAKVGLPDVQRIGKSSRRGKYVIVTATTPTPVGEDKLYRRSALPWLSRYLNAVLRMRRVCRFGRGTGSGGWS